jgi:hypothetical protein
MRVRRREWPARGRDQRPNQALQQTGIDYKGTIGT